MILEVVWGRPVPMFNPTPFRADRSLLDPILAYHYMSEFSRIFEDTLLGLW